jgi:hypothetical protein
VVRGGPASHVDTDLADELQYTELVEAGNRREIDAYQLVQWTTNVELSLFGTPLGLLRWWVQWGELNVGAMLVHELQQKPFEDPVAVSELGTVSIVKLHSVAQ